MRFPPPPSQHPSPFSPRVWGLIDSAVLQTGPGAGPLPPLSERRPRSEAMGEATAPPSYLPVLSSRRSRGASAQPPHTGLAKSGSRQPSLNLASANLRATVAQGPRETNKMPSLRLLGLLARPRRSEAVYFGRGRKPRRRRLKRKLGTTPPPQRAARPNGSRTQIKEPRRDRGRRITGSGRAPPRNGREGRGANKTTKRTRLAYRLRGNGAGRLRFMSGTSRPWSAGQSSQTVLSFDTHPPPRSALPPASASRLTR